MTLFIGIDPGHSGGIASIEGDTIHLYKMPQVEGHLVEIFEIFSRHACIAFIEKQGARPAYAPDPNNPGQTMIVQGVTSTWTFAEQYGLLRGVLAAFKIPREFIAPRDWQKGLGIPPKRKNPKESQTEWKNRLKQKACELYPRLKITLATADALLIAHYCMERHDTLGTWDEL